jgi:hypothetical protein
MSFNEDFLASLTPAELQQLIGGFNDSGYEDYGDYGSPSAFNFSYGGGGSSIQPSVDYFTTKGDINLSDRAQEAGRVNLLQDYGALSVDNILSGYAGGGAYDTGAFTPTYDYGEPLNLKGRRKAESLAGAGGWQGFVTDLILNKQMSPAEAEAMLYEFIEAPDDPKLTDQERAQKQAVTDSMKPLMAADTGGPASLSASRGGQSAATTAPYDTEPIRQFTTNVWSDLMEDPEFKYQDPESGLFYDKTPEEAMVKTPQMAAYDKFGIPYPTATYDDPKYMEAFTSMAAGGAGPEQRATEADAWLAQQEQLKRAAAGTRESERTARGATSDLESIWQEYQRDPQAFGQPTGPSDNPYNLPKDSLEAALKAAEIDFKNLDQTGAPNRDTFLQEALGRSTLPPMPRGPLPSAMAKDYNASREAANAAADIDYEGAFKDWQKENEDRLLDEAMMRSANARGINTPGQAPFVTSDRAGNVQPFSFGEEPAGGGGWMPRGSWTPRGVATTPTPRRMSEEDLAKQQARSKAATGKRSQAMNQVFHATYGDPRLAEVEAMGRAYALAQAGQTPFRDAMQARNANARRMLSGA